MANPYGGDAAPRPQWGPGGYPYPPNTPPPPPYPYPAGSGYPGVPDAWPTAPTSPGAPDRVQRPAVIGISAALTVTASLLWMVLLVFGLLVAGAVKQSFSYETQPDAALYHVADEFQVVMGNGLAGWLFGLPLVAVVAGFLLLVQRQWARISYTILGALTVGWSLWWLRDSIGWWVPAAAYVALAVCICWAPSVGRWYADPSRRRPR